MSERERLKFEAWYKVFDVNCVLDYSRDRYDCHITQAMWQTWQTAKQDSWVRYSDRKPAQADVDENGSVWFFGDGLPVQALTYTGNWELGYTNLFWHTKEKKPQPPKE